MNSTRSDNTVLIVEDEPLLRLTMGDHLRDRGLLVYEAESGERALEIFNNVRPAVVTLDLHMSPVDGHEVLSAIKEIDQEVFVIIISGQGEMHDVIRTLRAGAFDYLLKPIEDWEIFDRAVDRALDHFRLRNDYARLSSSFLSSGLQSPEDFSEIITCSSLMEDMFRYCEAVSKSGEPFLIAGETGVGKELLARAIHTSSRRNGAFIAVNIAGLDDHTFTDTLFGHARGAFTGADKVREGLMSMARGGTLFLDEIGDLGASSQIKLLRALHEREYYPIGSDQPRRLEARIVAATNKTISDLRSGNGFRQDFFFRVATHCVTIPSLRDRKEDVPVLMQLFIRQAAQSMQRDIPSYNEELVEHVCRYDFPGNVRELRALCFDAVARNGSTVLEIKDFPISLTSTYSKQDTVRSLFKTLEALPTLRAATDELVKEALHRSAGVQKKAAAILGITPQSLSERLKRASESS